MKHREFKNIMIINEIGLGNALLSLPFLVSLKETLLFRKIYHIENAFFREIYNPFLESMVMFPSSWMRINSKNYNKIFNYIVSNKITLLINFRNIKASSVRNKQYLILKNELEENGVVIWDMVDLPKQLQKAYIISQWNYLFKQKNLKINMRMQSKILKSILEITTMGNKKNIGFFLGASRKDKRISNDVWRKLIPSLKEQIINTQLVLFSGSSRKEKIEVIQLRNSIPDNNELLLEMKLTLKEFAQKIYNLKLLVTNDTFAMHLGVALDVPTIGLYSTTNRTIWGAPESAKFNGIQSKVCLECHLMPEQGTCYYRSSACIQIPNKSFDIEELKNKIILFYSKTCVTKTKELPSLKHHTK
jgi:ADP-heptose:LPS heptosyltransferase